MAGRKKQLDAKAKAKRQKVIAAGLGVVLLGVVGFQLPKMMKLSHHGSSSSASTTTATTAALPSSGATAAASATPAGASSVASLAGVGVKFTAGEGQLTSFTRFAEKDPFAAQITDTGSGTATTSAPLPSAPTTTPPATGGLTPVPSPTPPSSGSNGGSPSATPTQAVISVNGQSETVAGPSYNFPAADPIFHATIERQDVKVTIVGGSFASGSAALTLKLHKPVTLVNTATGTRYRLELLSLSAGGTTTR